MKKISKSAMRAKLRFFIYVLSFLINLNMLTLNFDKLLITKKEGIYSTVLLVRI